jgi:Mn-dependent DtxR family transcriptional regulator
VTLTAGGVEAARKVRARHSILLTFPEEILAVSHESAGNPAANAAENNAGHRST